MLAVALIGGVAAAAVIFTGGLGLTLLPLFKGLMIAGSALVGAMVGAAVGSRVDKKLERINFDDPQDDGFEMDSDAHQNRDLSGSRVEAQKSYSESPRQNSHSPSGSFFTSPSSDRIRDEKAKTDAGKTQSPKKNSLLANNASPPPRAEGKLFLSCDFELTPFLTRLSQKYLIL